MGDRSAAAEAGVFATKDPVLYEAAIRPWELNVDLRRSSRFECSIQYLKLDGITVYRDRYLHDMRLQGMTPPDTLTIALPNGGLTDDSAFWGQSIDANGIYPTFHVEIDSVTARHHDQFILLIDTDRDCAPEFAEIVDHFDMRKGPFLLKSGSRRKLQFLCRSALSWSSNPEFTKSDILCLQLRHDLIQALKDAFRDSSASQDLVIGRREKHAISMMFEYLMAECEPVISVARICAETGINERTLERAIREKFDCTVQNLLRRRRMHEARRRLVQSDRQTATVTQIAYELGFYDCGRFAGDYRDRFGELPSRTLHNSKVEIAEPLFTW